MIEFVLFLIPGAITYLIAEMMDKRKENAGFSDVVRFLVYTAMNTGILWFILYKRGMVSDWIISTEEGYYLTYTGGNFALAVILAITLGALLLVVKNAKILFARREDSFYLQLSDRSKKIFKVVLVLAVLVTTLVIVLKPRVDSMLMKNRKEDFQIAATDFLSNMKDKVASEVESGVLPEALEDIELDGVKVTRVTVDQKWTTASPTGRTEAVYMADNNGAVVYLSYRNKYYVGTWSGPTEDPEFIQSHGSWNGGRGYGWSGIGMK